MNNCYKSSRRTDGFTLVEVITVIAVIGILAAIVTISFNGSQNRANKSAYDSSAQQVKLKLGDYMTDRNNYPSIKGTSTSTADSVLKYLNDTGATTLATEFAKSSTSSPTSPVYSYTASPGGCNNTTTPCTGYTITVTRDKWSGPSSDSDIIITP